MALSDLFVAVKNDNVVSPGLKQSNIGGLVTDGSVRDTDEIINYGFPCFSYSTTARQGPAEMQLWECN